MAMHIYGHGRTRGTRARERGMMIEASTRYAAANTLELELWSAVTSSCRLPGPLGAGANTVTASGEPALAGCGSSPTSG